LIVEFVVCWSNNNDNIDNNKKRSPELPTDDDDRACRQRDTGNQRSPASALPPLSFSAG
jgi:hypothetical protein